MKYALQAIFFCLRHLNRYIAWNFYLKNLEVSRFLQVDSLTCRHSDKENMSGIDIYKKEKRELKALAIDLYFFLKGQHLWMRQGKKVEVFIRYGENNETRQYLGIRPRGGGQGICIDAHGMAELSLVRYVTGLLVDYMSAIDAQGQGDYRSYGTEFCFDTHQDMDNRTICEALFARLRCGKPNPLDAPKTEAEVPPVDTTFGPSNMELVA